MRKFSMHGFEKETEKTLSDNLIRRSSFSSRGDTFDTTSPKKRSLSDIESSEWENNSENSISTYEENLEDPEDFVRHLIIKKKKGESLTIKKQIRHSRLQTKESSDIVSDIPDNKMSVRLFKKLSNSCTKCNKNETESTSKVLPISKPLRKHYPDFIFRNPAPSKLLVDELLLLLQKCINNKIIPKEKK